MAARAGGRPVAVDLTEDRSTSRGRCARSATAPARVVICNPNDPTGTYIPADELGGLLGALPEHVEVLLDEAFVQFQDVEAGTPACA